jgi:hypothetical protein
VTRAGATRRRGRAKGPSLLTLAAALVVIALASYAGAADEATARRAAAVRQELTASPPKALVAA